MKVVTSGGTGQVGTILSRALTAAGHDVVILTRRPVRDRDVRWDAETLGPWAKELDGSDVVINLAGRSVNCRYTPDNLRAMMDSRVHSARVMGEAVAAASRPPQVWLQMSTATIYAHRFDAPNDEVTGVLGGTEPGVPGYWAYSVGGVFDVLLRLARLGLGGPVAGGAQYVSWIHDRDFVRAVEFLIDRDDLAGPVNLAAPVPLPQRTFMRVLRAARGVPVGLPATKRMAELGAFALRSDTELLLKSRRVVPGRLLEAGFAFDYPQWPEAADDLVRRLRGGPGSTM
ncbi:DUF1731 domain-containing protein [Nonomuraea sp. NPDC049486]|uniref:DUF1731 domain-containing protein n=1 Tax=Nonomuraea sp. NPDC049486 TaxID=3155773 RepID=UPI00342961A1